MTLNIMSNDNIIMQFFLYYILSVMNFARPYENNSPATHQHQTRVRAPAPLRVYKSYTIVYNSCRHKYCRTYNNIRLGIPTYHIPDALLRYNNKTCNVNNHTRTYTHTLPDREDYITITIDMCVRVEREKIVLSNNNKENNNMTMIMREKIIRRKETRKKANRRGRR